jgi:glycosyltransferase involved in cell wall biosynthesis
MAFSHSFVIPAYKASPWLDDCIASLLRQSHPSPILISTSTPNAHVEQIASKYGLEVRVHQEGGCIAADWNAALDAAETDLVTLAHQDDRYLPDFTERTLKAFEQYPKAAFCYSLYQEIEENSPTARPAGLNLHIKRLLSRLAHARDPALERRFSRWLLLAFGCPVPCPSVTFNLSLLQPPVFDDSYSVSLDWAAWIKILETHQAAWIPEPLMQHRIHAQSETSAAIGERRRQTEDLRLFRKMWPLPLAAIISYAYRISHRNNRTDAQQP